jgi:hypothetical protein
MSSPFDQDEPIVVIKPKKQTQAESTPAPVSTSNSNANSRIRVAITKLMTRNLMGKRSVIISKIVENLFPDMEDTEETVVYGAIDATIMAMVAENELQEFRFVDQQDTMIEAMLVVPSLALDLDLSVEDDDEDDTDTDVVDEENSDLFEEESPEMEKELENLFGIKPTEPEVLKALHERVQMFAVYTNANDKTECKLVKSAAGALAELSDAQRYSGVYAQIFGMIPIEVKVDLAFVSEEEYNPKAAESEIEMTIDQDQTPPEEEAEDETADSETPSA